MNESTRSGGDDAMHSEKGTTMIVSPNANNPSTKQASRSAALLAWLASPLSLLLAALIVGMIGYFAMQMRTTVVLERMEADVKQRERKANASVKNAALRQAELTEQEALAVASSKLSAVLQKLHSADATLIQLKTSADKLTRLKNRLLHEELGRRVASNNGLIDQAEKMMLVMQGQGAIDLQALDQRLRSLEQPLLSAKSDLPPDYTPSISIVAAIEEVESETQRKLATLNKSLVQLDALEQQAANLPITGTASLQVILSSRQESRLREEAAVRAQTLDLARKANDAMVLNATLEKERLIAETKKRAEDKVAEETATRIRIDAEKEASKMAAETERIKLAGKAEALEREFQRDRANIQRLLIAFVSEGVRYRGDALSRGPVSFAVMQSRGVLTPGRKGIEAICYMASNENDREKGQLPYHSGRYDWWEEVDRTLPAKAQEYLIKYGDLMVKAGMLAK
jgi:hypothetical protein